MSIELSAAWSSRESAVGGEILCSSALEHAHTRARCQLDSLFGEVRRVPRSAMSTRGDPSDRSRGMSLGNLGSNLSMKSLFDGAAEVKKRASQVWRSSRRRRRNPRLSSRVTWRRRPPSPRLPSKLPPSAADVDPADADMYVNLPVSSARKLRFYDNADLTEIIAGHLSEKMALAEENARLTSALESILEGGRDELKDDSPTPTPSSPRPNAPGERRMASIASCWSPRKPSFRQTERRPRRRATRRGRCRHGSRGGRGSGRRERSTGGATSKGWEAADDDVEAAENDVADAEVTGSSPASATKSHSSGSQTWASDAVLESRAAAAEARCAELERQLEAAKTIAAEEAEDTAESEDAVEAAAEEAEARLETVTRELTTKVRRLEAELEAAKTSVRR